MAKLTYPEIILKQPKFTALADLAKRFEQQDTAQITTTLIDLISDDFTQLLAEKWSATGYDGMFLAGASKNKKQLIKNSIELHRLKGTPWSIREILRTLGLGEVILDEGLKLRDYTGNTFVATIPPNEIWAHFAIVLQKPISNDRVEEVKKIINSFKPARCILAVLDYKASILYNNKAKYNGNYNHGSA